MTPYNCTDLLTQEVPLYDPDSINLQLLLLGFVKKCPLQTDVFDKLFIHRTLDGFLLLIGLCELPLVISHLSFCSIMHQNHMGDATCPGPLAHGDRANTPE